MLTFSRYSIFDFAIFHYAERLSSGAGGGISNQLGAEPISWNNLKKRFRFIDIAKKIQKKIKCKIIPSNQNIVLNDPIININKVCKEFKFNPKRNLLKDMDKIIDYLN